MVIITTIFILIKLDFKKKNENLCKVSFLYLSVEVHNRKFTFELFDERDAFPFYVNGMHYLDSNIPSKTFYASVKSEILRIANVLDNKLPD